MSKMLIDLGSFIFCKGPEITEYFQEGLSKGMPKKTEEVWRGTHAYRVEVEGMSVEKCLHFQPDSKFIESELAATKKKEKFNENRRLLSDGIFRIRNAGAEGDPSWKGFHVFEVETDDGIVKKAREFRPPLELIDDRIATMKAEEGLN